MVTSHIYEPAERVHSYEIIMQALKELQEN